MKVDNKFGDNAATFKVMGPLMKPSVLDDSVKFTLPLRNKIVSFLVIDVLFSFPLRGHLNFNFRKT